VPATPSFTTETETHEAFQARIQREFLKRHSELGAALKEPLETVLRADTEESRLSALSETCRAANRLAGHAGLAGFEAAAEMASALADLMRELIENPSSISASTLRTIVDSCDTLADSPRPADEPSHTPAAPPIVLVVDDEAVARRAICLALNRISLAAISVDGPEAALGLLAENKFSLIVLDIQMPGMNGFDLCRELRTLHPNDSTPVIFVTSLSEFETRERVVEVGGNDLMAKPFLPMELAVKALSLMRRP
jgi:CheY-like chemotaxis protein